jgi:hypothetical protein
VNLDWIATALGARSAHYRERIQPLWGGCGELFRIDLDGERTAIVKWATPPKTPESDVSTTRKLRSFAVEAAFYQLVAPRCDADSRVSALLASRSTAGETVLVLEDLDAAGFDRRVDEASGAALDTALAWLASFHARFLGEHFAELWPIGTYWQLDTRRDELPAIDDVELRDAAPAIAERLVAARFQTLVHGDPKEANFCFTRAYDAVAAVDFQYTGRACAMTDVAYLLYGRSDEPTDGIDSRRLDTYFRNLRRALGVGFDADALETEWRALYPIARLDFCRFLAGWRPSLWRADRRGQRFVRTMLPL